VSNNPTDAAEAAALDPQVKALLAMLVAAGRPKIWQVTPAEAREGILALAKAADAKNVPIGRIENGELPGLSGPLRYRIYTPAGSAAGTLAAIVYFHGGGFVIGNLDTQDGMCRLLANASGCRLVSVDYRLAPEHKFPAAIEDGIAAVSWVAREAARNCIDPARIAVAGDSAGANIAAVVCQSAQQAGGPKIALQVLFCPPTDALHDTESSRAFAEGYLLEAEGIRWFGQHTYPPDADPRDPRISPLYAGDLAGLPPAHIHTAAFDPLRDEGKAYADRLRRSGVAVRYTCHDGMIHHFYALAGAIPYAFTAIEQAGGAIKQALQDQTG
jgi:acetyl esterase